MLRTRFMSQGYVSPELLGLLPRDAIAKTYTNEIDIWALGCIVHELLTGEIPFLDSKEYFVTESTESESDDAPMPQTDVGALKEFCDGLTEFPSDGMRRSGVSDAAEECVRSMLVVIPKFRVAAKDALQSAWLLEQDDPVVTPESGENNHNRSHRM